MYLNYNDEVRINRSEQYTRFQMMKGFLDIRCYDDMKSPETEMLEFLHAPNTDVQDRTINTDG